MTTHAVPEGKADHGCGQNHCSYPLAKQSAIKQATGTEIYFQMRYGDPKIWEESRFYGVGKLANFIWSLN